MYKEIIKEIGIEKYRELFKAVYSMDAVEIISMYEPLEETKKAGVYSCLCPFHSETSKGAFSVTRSYKGNTTGGYYCFGCGAFGNGITYVKDKFFGGSSDNREAVLKIAQDKGLLTIGHGNISTKEYIKKELPKTIELQEIKDVEFRDKVYRLFLECCDLKKEDREYLKTYRGLTDEQIDAKGYRSAANRTIFFPEGDSRITKGLKSFTSKLAQQNIQREDLLGIPGFYLEETEVKGKKQFKVTFSKVQGILIPCKNASGQIQAIQIDPKAKLKKHWNGPKYYWWSSSQANGAEKQTETRGCKAGAPIGVIYPKELKSSTVYITEGDYKAEAIAKEFGAVAITFQGVSNWKGIDDVLLDIELSDYFQSKYNGINEIGVAFDGDMLYNYAVYIQLKNMTDVIQQLFVGKTYYLCWDTRKGKGIDDVLHQNENALEILRCADKQKWDVNYAQCVENICTRLNIEAPLDVPADQFKKEVIKEIRTLINKSRAN